MGLVLAVALAFFAGYAAIIAACLTVTFAIVSLFPKFVANRGRLTPSYLAFNAGLWLIASVAGGYITSELAGWSPLGISLSLALVLFAVMVWSAFDLRDHQPLGFQLFVSVLAGVGVIAGAFVHLKI